MMSPERVFNHDEFCYLTLRQRLLALALAILADEEGRGIGHPAWLRGRVFPVEAEHISLSEIERDCEAIMIILEPPKIHQAAGKPFIALDLTDVEVAIDFDPEARQFFLDLAYWLLFRCVEGEFGGL